MSRLPKIALFAEISWDSHRFESMKNDDRYFILLKNLKVMCEEAKNEETQPVFGRSASAANVLFYFCKNVKREKTRK